MERRKGTRPEVGARWALAPRARGGLLGLIFGLAACGSDASDGLDGGGGHVGAVDATPADAGRDAGQGADAQVTQGPQSEGTVAECQAAVDRAARDCDDQRTCFWDVFRAQCERGTDDVIREAAACFADDPSCRAMGDPGTAENLDCTNAALARARSPAAEASIEALCEACPTQDDLCTPNGNGSFGAPFEFLPDDAQPALQACLAAARDCDAAIDCAVDAFDSLAACLD